MKRVVCAAAAAAVIAASAATPVMAGPAVRASATVSAVDLTAQAIWLTGAPGYLSDDAAGPFATVRPAFFAWLGTPPSARRAPTLGELARRASMAQPAPLGGSIEIDGYTLADLMRDRDWRRRTARRLGALSRRPGPALR